MIEAIEQTIESRNLLGAETPLVVMVSGGSDSTALAYAVSELHKRGKVGQPAILHVNHMIRGEAANADARFVEKLAASLGIPFFGCEINVPALVAASGGNAEAIGRRERYLAAHEALESLCRHVAVPVSEGRIATAHTQDDRVENFFMRSIAGTGPGGFRSMLYRNGPVVRPCLDVSREGLRSYVNDLPQGIAVLDEQGNRWREDATNAHTDRFRAYVRHEVIPAVKRRSPQLLDVLGRTMNLIADEDDMLDGMAAELLDAHVAWVESAPGRDPDWREGGVIAPELGKQPTPLVRRVVVRVLQLMLGPDARVETSSVDAVLAAWDDLGLPQAASRGGYVANVQGNIAVSANKRGVRLEPMAAFRARRKKQSKGRNL